jgi:mannosyltransferase
MEGRIGRRNRWAAAAGLIALTGVAAVLRLPGLDQGLWYDEIMTIVLSLREPLTSIVQKFPSNNVHPLYSVLGHLSVVVLGEHAWTIRLPAVVFGVASIPLMYATALEVASRREAFFSAVILTVSYQHVWFSQNARGYSALAFWTLLCTWLFFRARRRNSYGLQTAYACAAALGVYTHMTMGFIIATHALIVAGRRTLGRYNSDRQTESMSKLWLYGFGLATVLSLALYAPVLLQMHTFFTATASSNIQIATGSWAFVEALRGLKVGLGTIGLVVAATLAGVGLLAYAKQNWEVAALFVGPALMTVLSTIVLRRPMFPRFFFFLIGFAVMFIVRGIIVIASRLDGAKGSTTGVPLRPVVEAIFVLALVGASAATLPSAYGPKQDFDGALDFINASRTADEPVLTMGVAANPYMLYYRVPWTVITDAAQLNAARAHASRVWMVYTMPAYLVAKVPDVMKIIDADCPTVRRFRGSVGDGDMMVCVFKSETGQEKR